MSYQYVNLQRVPGGFGEWQRCPVDLTDQHESVASCLAEITDADAVVELIDGAELPAGVEDIRGNVREEPDRIYAIVYPPMPGRPEPQVCYFGLDDLGRAVGGRRGIRRVFGPQTA